MVLLESDHKMPVLTVSVSPKTVPVGSKITVKYQLKNTDSVKDLDIVDVRATSPSATDEDSEYPDRPSSDNRYHVQSGKSNGGEVLTKVGKASSPFSPSTTPRNVTIYVKYVVSGEQEEHQVNKDVTFYMKPSMSWLVLAASFASILLLGIITLILKGNTYYSLDELPNSFNSPGIIRFILSSVVASGCCLFAVLAGYNPDARSQKAFGFSLNSVKDAVFLGLVIALAAPTIIELVMTIANATLDSFGGGTDNGSSTTTPNTPTPPPG